MIITLDDTTAGQINARLAEVRGASGGGMIFTLIVPTTPEHLDEVRAAAMKAGQAHPSRIIVIDLHPDDPADRVDATLTSGDELPGELVTATLRGQIARHPSSALLPLLLTDSPVIVWWPFDRPEVPADDPIGQLATKRITDSSSAPDPVTAILQRARQLQNGDADLAWSRLTHWRTLLVAALDQYPAPITSGVVEAEEANAPSLLMQAWLADHLGVPVTLKHTDGPGLTAVRLATDQGEIVLKRTDRLSACYQVPGIDARTVELTRRTLTGLITEELHLLDADPVFTRVASAMLAAHGSAERVPGGQR